MHMQNLAETRHGLRPEVQERASGTCGKRSAPAWIGGRLGLSLIGGMMMVACGASGEQETPAPTPTATPAPAVTWHQDIQPLVERVCARCHMEGGVAPSQFSDYATASARAATLASYVTSGYMPPRAADPTCSPYHYWQRTTLTDEERQLFATWAELGAPEGKAETAPEPVEYLNTLDDADTVLRLPSQHFPTFDETGNQYACYVVSQGQAEAFFATGFDADVDRGEILHHIVLYKGHFPEDGTVPVDDFSKGWDCMEGGLDGDWSFVAAWAPGGGPILLPEGTGLRVNPEDWLVMQMHYFKSSPDAEKIGDQSGYKLRTVPAVERELYYMAFGNNGFTIPAGDPNYSYPSSFVMPPGYGTLRIYGVFPHMHVLGTRYEYTVRDRQETSCVLRGEWDFHNQMTYMLETPIDLEPGMEATFTCTWDNSASNPNQHTQPPVDISYGERTQEEMCFGFTLATLE